MQIWTLYTGYRSDFAILLENSNEAYVKTLYPVTMGINIMFLYYNWLYVIQYFKSAQLLPIVLNVQHLEADGINVSDQMHEALSKVGLIDLVWNSMSLLSILAAIVVGVIWDEQQVFAGCVIIDSTFILMSLYFVVVFAWSITKIRVMLRSANTEKFYLNEKVIKAQLTIFVGFFLLYVS